jgi:hypothetical protein
LTFEIWILEFLYANIAVYMPNIKPPIRSLEDIEENLQTEVDDPEETFVNTKPKGVGKASELRKGIFKSNEKGEDDPLDDKAENDEKEELEDKDDLDDSNEKEDREDDENEEVEEKIEEEPEEEPEEVLDKDSKHELDKPLNKLYQDEAFQKGVFGKVDEVSEEDGDTLKPQSMQKTFTKDYDSSKEDPYTQNERENSLNKPSSTYYNEDLEDDSDTSMHIPNIRSQRHEDFQVNQVPNSQNFPPPKSFNQDRPTFSPSFNSTPRRRGISPVHIILLILIGLAVIGATVYLLKNQFNVQLGFLQKPTPTPEVTMDPVSTPMPTQEPVAIDRSQYKIRVLNGTTTTGLAASVSAKLKDLGYQQEKTGNATNSAFAKTQVRVKPDNDNLSAQLIRDLSDKFSAELSIPLKPSDTADGEVILGQE